MPANITYRGATVTPAVPGSTSAANVALSNAQVDGNFKSVADAILAAEASLALKSTIDYTLAMSIALG